MTGNLTSCLWKVINAACQRVSPETEALFIFIFCNRLIVKSLQGETLVFGPGGAGGALWEWVWGGETVGWQEDKCSCLTLTAAVSLPPFHRTLFRFYLVTLRWNKALKMVYGLTRRADAQRGKRQIMLALWNLPLQRQFTFESTFLGRGIALQAFSEKAHCRRRWE